MEGLDGLVDGEHFFDAISEESLFEFLYEFPGWPLTVKGRRGMMDALSGYGDNIVLHSGDGLVVHHTTDEHTVIIEYQVHGKILANDVAYNNRFISVITIENRKIVHWRDYMDSLAAWNAITGARN